MIAWRPTLAEWFRDHHGIINITQLLTLGCSERTVRRMVAAGELVVAQPGVYRSSHYPDGRDQQLAAICARDPLALISFTTACRSWGFRRVEDEGRHVLVPHSSRSTFVGATVHRCRSIAEVDIVRRPDGIRLTSPPRTLFDSADMLGPRAAKSVLEQILHERMCTLETVIDTYLRLNHPHRPGSRVMGEVLRSRPKWQEALQSDLEHRVHEAIQRLGLPPAVPQCPVHLPSGRLLHLDFGWPEWKVGLEVDDPCWHAGEAERHRDVHRDRKAATVGWAVSRVSKIDVEGDLNDAVADIGLIIACRQAA